MYVTKYSSFVSNSKQNFFIYTNCPEYRARKMEHNKLNINENLGCNSVDLHKRDKNESKFASLGTRTSCFDVREMKET